MVVYNKHIKIIIKRSYRAKILYDFFQNLFQAINTTFLEFESILPININAKFDTHFVKRKLNMSHFCPKYMNERRSSSALHQQNV